MVCRSVYPAAELHRKVSEGSVAWGRFLAAFVLSHLE
jgi:hypothetical protein